MKVNIFELKKNIGETDTRDILYDYIIYVIENNTEGLDYTFQYKTIEEIGFFSVSKKDTILDLEQIKDFDDILYERVVLNLLSKFIHKDTDPSVDGDDLLFDDFEKESMDTYNPETINEFNNDNLLTDSYYSKVLNHSKILNIKKNKLTLNVDLIKKYDHVYGDFVSLSLIMINNMGIEYNKVVVDSLIELKILED